MNPQVPVIAVRLLQVAYYFYAVITPLSCLVFLLMLLVFPMSFSKQRWIRVAAEIANAWSAVEVFVLSIGAALLQISTFASFIIGDRCDIINMLLRDAMGTGEDEEVSCFSVEASIEPNFWYLLGGAVLNSFVVSFGLSLAHLFMDERQEERLERSSGAPFGLSGDMDESTVAKRIYNLPLIGCIVFGCCRSSLEEGDERSAGGSEFDGDGSDDEDQPEWRHWF